MQYWQDVVKGITGNQKQAKRFMISEAPSEYLIQPAEPKEKKIPKSYYLEGEYKDIYFTQREVECLYFMLQGCSIVKTARLLDLSARTVEFYLKNMRVKLSASSKNHLLALVANSQLAQKLPQLLPHLVSKMES